MLFGKSFFFSKKEQKSEEGKKLSIGDKAPMDERFAVNFINNGGKFIYCEKEQELQNFLAQIIGENGEDFRIFHPRDSLSERFSKFKDYFTTSFNHANGYISGCESLIADTGAILFSSRQIGQKKIKELPHTLIVCATTSQIVLNLRDALQGIAYKNKEEKPSNISAFHNFKENDEDDFLTYGSSHKQTYLLLLEDLN